MTDAGVRPSAPPTRPSRHVIVALVVSVLAMLPAFGPLPPQVAPFAPIGVAALPFVAIFAFSNPFALCLAFVIFSFFRIHEAFPALNSLRIPQMLAIPTLIVLGWHVFIQRSFDLFWSRSMKIFVVFFIMVTIGIMFASNKPESVAFWTANYWKEAIMTLAIAWLTRRPRDMAIASHAFVFAGILIAAVALYNKTHGIGLVEGTRVTIGRDIGSLLGDPNDLSLVLLFPLSFAVSLFTRRTGWISAIFGIFGTGMVIAAIIATQSRGGLLGMMTVCGVYGFRMVKSKALLLSVVGIAAPILYLAAGISGRQSGGAAEQGIDESAQGRLWAWQAAWNMATTHPLNGVGLNGFFSNYFFFTPHWDGMNHAVHSTWFVVLAETGFPGLAVFVTMVFSIEAAAFFALRHLEKTNAPMSARAMGNAVFAGVAGFCVSGTFLTQGFTWPIYVQLALGAAVANFAMREGEPSQAANTTAIAARS